MAQLGIDTKSWTCFSMLALLVAVAAVALKVHFKLQILGKKQLGLAAGDAKRDTAGGWMIKKRHVKSQGFWLMLVNIYLFGPC